MSRILPKHIYQRRKQEFYTIIDGRQITLAKGDLELAKKKLAELRGLAAPEHTIESMVHRFLAYAVTEKRPDGSPRWSAKTLHDYTANLTRSVLPVFGHMLMSELFPSHAQQFLARRAAEGRAVDGNRCLSALATCFTWALGQPGCPIQFNPCRGARRNPEYPRTRNVTPAELNAFLALAKRIGGARYMVALIEALVAISGRRRGEIIGLTVRDFDARRDVWMVRDSKNRSRTYDVPNTALVAQVMAEAKALRGFDSIVVFPTQDGRAYTTSGVAGLWQKMMAKWVQGGGEHFTGHDLRALYVTQIKERGGDPETHANPSTTAKVYDRRRVRKVTTLG